LAEQIEELDGVEIICWSWGGEAGCGGTIPCEVVAFSGAHAVLMPSHPPADPRYPPVITRARQG
jgi:hypothetical protein